MRERKHQYNQGDLLRFQRTVGIGPFTPHLCVITEVLTFGDWADKHYKIQWLQGAVKDSFRDSSYQVYESSQVDRDPNFTLLARA